MSLRFLAVAFIMLCSFLAHAGQYSDPFDEMKRLYDLYGGNFYMIDEPITQQLHVLQAAYLADFAGAPEEVVIALLLHDIGQLAQEDQVGNLAVLHYAYDDYG